MALGNDEDPDPGSNGPQQPFAYVLIPILGFGLIVSVLTCYKYKRRKARLARMAAEGIAFARDPETGRVRGPNGTATGRRRAGRRLGLGVGSREEGLNELGEAPPAYTPNAPKPPSENGGGIELMTYSQATAEIGTSRSPPGYGQEPRAGPAGDSTSGDGGPGGADDAAARLSAEMRRDAPRNATAHDISESTRPSQELRRNTPGNASTAVTSDTATQSEETRRETPENTATTGTGGVSSTTISNEDATIDTPPTASGAGQSTRPSEEITRDITKPTTGTTTASTSEAANTATAPSSTAEPSRPPKAVLPSSSSGSN
ncbi:hypothetical protein F5Y08DRAFT_259020 [Xylaria arbuscula]|nr:hypothetical protein F5Y08DRAFT_259020 [Xylaria arbuscula]